MSYLLDKKIQRRKFSQIALGMFFLAVLFFFRLSVWNGLSFTMEIISHPFLVLGQNFNTRVSNVSSYFIFKNSLYLQNQKLLDEVKENDARMANYDSVVADNISLKEILNRKDPKVNMLLAGILAKPNQSLYDTLIVDAGTTEGVKADDTVFALGDVPIGRVVVAYNSSSKIILFSNPGEKVQAVLAGKSVELTGRGGGNFEIIIPKDFVLQKGDQVVLPGVHAYVLAIMQTIISDPRDPFTKALLTSPVNIQEIKLVQIEI